MPLAPGERVLLVNHVTRTAFLGLALLVSACASFGDGSAGLCPVAAILDEPGQLVRFQTAASSGPGDMLFQTKMKKVSGVCDFDEKSIDLELGIVMEALRGPANKAGRAKFVYFVAILNRDKEVLNRVEFPMLAIFERQDTRVDFVEDVTVTIPRRKGDTPNDYLVYLGFEMTQAELAYNRRRLKR